MNKESLIKPLPNTRNFTGQLTYHFTSSPPPPRPANTYRQISCYTFTAAERKDAGKVRLWVQHDPAADRQGGWERQDLQVLLKL